MENFKETAVVTGISVECGLYRGSAQNCAGCFRGSANAIGRETIILYGNSQEELLSNFEKSVNKRG